jgi:hypothetical protein
VPIRRLNYTSRKRIARSDIDIVLGGSPEAPSFDAALDLGAYGFPPDARVFVEAYRQTVLMRFDFGTVSAPGLPHDRTLADFQSTEEILFRVRVTATSGRPGVLLGEADRLRPREPDRMPDQRLPLLPAMPDDLGQEVWRVDFEGGTTLLVNRDLPDWKQTVSSDAFRAIAYPAAMRQILERILFVEKYAETDDPYDWRSQWLQFASQVPGSRAVPVSREDQSEWIENAVAAFARRFHLLSRYSADLAQQ